MCWPPQVRVRPRRSGVAPEGSTRACGTSTGSTSSPAAAWPSSPIHRHGRAAGDGRPGPRRGVSTGQNLGNRRRPGQPARARSSPMAGARRPRICAHGCSNHGRKPISVYTRRKPFVIGNRSTQKRTGANKHLRSLLPQVRLSTQRELASELSVPRAPQTPRLDTASCLASSTHNKALKTNLEPWGPPSGRAERRRSGNMGPLVGVLSAREVRSRFEPR